MPTKAAALFLSALSLSCGSTYGDLDGAKFAWESRVYGVGILPGPQENYFTTEVVDASVQHVVSALCKTLNDVDCPSMWGAVQGVRLQVEETDFPCPTTTHPHRRCQGQQLHYKLRLTIQPCVWLTALQHELTHFFLDYTLGWPDPEHLWTNVWTATQVQLGECDG